MICPQCHRVLETATEGRLATHNCGGCGGTWIRGQSLHSLIAKSGDSTDIEQTLDEILKLDFRESQRPCPSCVGRHLKAVVIENTELDFCAACKGLFFDPGELERVFPGIHGQSRDAQNSGPRGFWSSLLKFIDER